MLLACCLDGGLFDVLLITMVVGWVAPIIQTYRNRKKANDQEP